MDHCHRRSRKQRRFKLSKLHKAFLAVWFFIAALNIVIMFMNPIAPEIIFSRKLMPFVNFAMCVINLVLIQEATESVQSDAEQFESQHPFDATQEESSNHMDELSIHNVR